MVMNPMGRQKTTLKKQIQLVNVVFIAGYSNMSPENQWLEDVFPY